MCYYCCRCCCCCCYNSAPHRDLQVEVGCMRHPGLEHGAILHTVSRQQAANWTLAVEISQHAVAIAEHLSLSRYNCWWFTASLGNPLLCLPADSVVAVPLQACLVRRPLPPPLLLVMPAGRAPAGACCCCCCCCAPGTGSSSPLRSSSAPCPCPQKTSAASTARERINHSVQQGWHDSCIQQDHL
jgi:hypothetical protein